MIELELLGVLPEGDLLSLNDAEGNRYTLPITDSLRAALRKDTQPPTGNNDVVKTMTPREIQAHIRAGLSVAEVCDLSSLPAAQIAAFAHPIFAEREYMAQQARNFRQSSDSGSMTIEELVVSRLVPRGVAANKINWDATRNSGESWMLLANYSIGDDKKRASWEINSRTHALTATNDEAKWLTETQIPTPTSPWRPVHTPEVPTQSPKPATSTPAATKITALDAKPASAGTPSIDDMLASLDSQRGKARSMPGIEEFAGAHPAASDVEGTRDATVLTLPTRSEKKPEKEPEKEPEKASSATPPTAGSADDGALPLGKEALKRVEKPNRSRRKRPTMPSWDEIVFGSSPKE